jgi:PRC-barrel domain
MDQANQPMLAASELNAVNLVEAHVYNEGGDKIGTVAHVYGEGTALEVIVDIGGFLLMGPKPVSLMASQLVFTRQENGQVHVKTSLSKPELAALLEHTPPERR